MKTTPCSQSCEEWRSLALGKKKTKAAMAWSTSKARKCCLEWKNRTTVSSLIGCDERRRNPCVARTWRNQGSWKLAQTNKSRLVKALTEYLVLLLLVYKYYTICLQSCLWIQGLSQQSQQKYIIIKWNIELLKWK